MLHWSSWLLGRAYAKISTCFSTAAASSTSVWVDNSYCISQLQHCRRVSFILCCFLLYIRYMSMESLSRKCSWTEAQTNRLTASCFVWSSGQIKIITGRQREVCWEVWKWREGLEVVTTCWYYSCWELHFPLSVWRILPYWRNFPSRSKLRN